MLSCISSTLLHRHLLSLLIIYVKMPCPSIIKTYSICHHTMFFHSNVDALCGLVIISSIYFLTTGVPKLRVYVPITGLICTITILVLELTMQLSYSFSIFSAFVVGAFAALISYDIAKVLEARLINYESPESACDEMKMRASDLNLKN